MPAWVDFEKYCEVCGEKLLLRSNRDIIRKRFCSRKCTGKGTTNGWKGKRLSKEHKEKISEAKKGQVSMKGESHWRTGMSDSFGKYKYKCIDDKLKRVHQIVMEECLGRELLPGEAVHHKNGNREDNRIENLELTIRSEHTRFHVAEDRKRYLAAKGG